MITIIMIMIMIVVVVIIVIILIIIIIILIIIMIITMITPAGGHKAQGRRSVHVTRPSARVGRILMIRIPM